MICFLKISFKMYFIFLCSFVSTFSLEKNLIEIKIEDKIFQATLLDNQTSKAFIKKLPLTITMEDFNQNEKFHRFSEKFPVNPTKMENIKTGDIVFYETNFFVIFYEDFKTQYVYTPIGTINNISGLKEVFKKSKVTVELK